LLQLVSLHSNLAVLISSISLGNKKLKVDTQPLPMPSLLKVVPPAQTLPPRSSPPLDRSPKFQNNDTPVPNLITVRST